MMKTPVRLLALALPTLLGPFPCRDASADYTFSILATINNSPYDTGGLTMDAHGNLYGATFDGAANPGTVYEVVKGSGTATTLATFNGTNGSYPLGTLAVDSGGNVSGTTNTGGTAGGGTAFTIKAGSGAVTTLYNFDPYNPTINGSGPQGGLTLDSKGNLYGTTSTSDANSVTSRGGTIFRIDASTGTLTTLYNFPLTGTNSPVTGLTFDSQGNLYGTTQNSSGGGGAVYELSAQTGLLTTLATFNGTNGSSPIGNLVFDAQGNLYGTTAVGGLYNGGTAFEIAAGTGQLTTLANFQDGATGGLPGGLTMDAQGNLFGATREGVYEIAAGSRALSILTFPGVPGIDGSLAVDSQGNIYGADSLGFIFELSPTAAAVPEPATMIGLAQGVGLLALVAFARARRVGGRRRIDDREGIPEIVEPDKSGR